MSFSAKARVRSRIQRLPLWAAERTVGNHTKITRLWLYPELNISSCVDDCTPAGGEEQLEYYVDVIRRDYPHYWEEDAVPIYWSVRGDGDGFGSEQAPFHMVGIDRAEDVRTYYRVVSARTGKPVNWYRLPVINSRFPEFAEALGWLPSPGQQFAPLRSIIEGPQYAVPRERIYA